MLSLTLNQHSEVQKWPKCLNDDVQILFKDVLKFKTVLFVSKRSYLLFRY